MSTIFIKKNQGLKNPQISKEHDNYQRENWSCSKKITGENSPQSKIIIKKGDDI